MNSSAEADYEIAGLDATTCGQPAERLEKGCRIAFQRIYDSAVKQPGRIGV
jgi:hypothetical protein